MRRDYNFEIGQRVYKIPAEGWPNVYGIVTDTSSVSVFIKWEGLAQDAEHFMNEYIDIELDNRKRKK